MHKTLCHHHSAVSLGCICMSCSAGLGRAFTCLHYIEGYAGASQVYGTRTPGLYMADSDTYQIPMHFAHTASTGSET